MRPINIAFYQEKIFVVYLFINNYSVKTGDRLDVIYSEYVKTCREKLNTKYIFGLAKFTEIMQELGCVRYVPRKEVTGRYRFWKIPPEIPIQEAFRYMESETKRLVERLKRKNK